MVPDRHASCTWASMASEKMGDGASRRPIWIVEDEPAVADLAADLCRASGATASVFRAASPYLDALRQTDAPVAVVLDWRLQNEISAAIYLATRYRYPHLPVIFWTGSATSRLPAMVRGDDMTVVIDKADGAAPLERALAWALRDGSGPPPR
jgi:CheY-like chemotaxis protein